MSQRIRDATWHHIERSMDNHQGGAGSCQTERAARRRRAGNEGRRGAKQQRVIRHNEVDRFGLDRGDDIRRRLVTHGDRGDLGSRIPDLKPDGVPPACLGERNQRYLLDQ